MAGKKLYGKEALARDLVNEFPMTLDKARQLVSFIIDNITEAVVDGKLVKLGDLGTLHLKEHMPRVGTDPRTGVTINIPRTYSVKAKISTTLRRHLKERKNEGQ